jgi:hypothetical protein
MPDHALKNKAKEQVQKQEMHDGLKEDPHPSRSSGRNARDRFA